MRNSHRTWPEILNGRNHFGDQSADRRTVKWILKKSDEVVEWTYLTDDRDK
jgi:hypothetical protein